MSVNLMQSEATSEAATVEPTGPLPMIFGITGHRDLINDDAIKTKLKKQVGEVFGRFRREHKHTPMILLSPLADGADRLVADVALKCGVRLIVPLPMDVEEYEKDFVKPGSLQEFRRLIALAERFFVVEPETGPPVAGEEGRDAAYLRAGLYVARHCQFLIALWDGRDTDQVGDASQVVKAKLEGVPPEFGPSPSRLDPPEVGPVIRIATPRASHPESTSSLIATFDRFPGEHEEFPTVSEDNDPPAEKGREIKARVAFAEALGLMDKFNRDASPPRGNRPAETAKNRGYVYDETKEGALPDGLGALLDLYAEADTLAISFQRRWQNWLPVILLVGFLVTLLLQAHIRWRAEHPLKPDAIGTAWVGEEGWLFKRVPGFPFHQDPADSYGLAWYDVAFVLAAVGLYASVLAARVRHDQKMHMDYRAVAEGLRVQFFWSLAGLRASAADHYLRRQKGPLSWVRLAVRAGETLAGPPPRSEGIDPTRLDRVCRLWGVDQQRYFIGQRVDETGPDGRVVSRVKGSVKARYNEIRGRLFRDTNWALLFVIGPAFIVVRAVCPPSHFVTMLLALVTTILVILGLYARIMAFSEHARQYSRMGALFANANDALKGLLDAPPLDLDAASDLLQELGEEALAESGDWLLLHRDRPIEPPRP